MKKKSQVVIHFFGSHFFILILITLLILSTAIPALASGNSSSDPLVTTIDSVEIFHSTSVSDSTLWLSIIGNGNVCRMKIKPGMSTQNPIAISSVELFSGSSQALVGINSWNYHADDSLTLDLGRLDSNQTYFFRITRQTSAQAEIEVAAFDPIHIEISYSLPLGYPYSNFSSCFPSSTSTINHDLDVTVTIHDLRYYLSNVLYVEVPYGASIIDFAPNPNTAVDVIQISATMYHVQTYTNPPGNNAHLATVHFYINVSDCGDYNSSSLPVHVYFPTQTYPANPVFQSNNPWVGHSDPDNYLLVPIEHPHVSFESTNIGGTTIPSHDNDHFLRYDQVKRFYKIKPTSGIVNYFTLDITPEPDVQIEAIETIDVNSPNPSTASPLFAIYNSTPLTTSQKIIFSDGTSQGTPGIYVPISNCYRFSNGSSGPDYLLPGNGTEILIRETIGVTQIYDCDPIPNNATVYHLAVHCDHTPDATSECASMDATLNVICQPEPQVLTVSAISNNVTACSTNGTYTVTISNGSAPSPHPGSGTVEITGISFSINPIYFDFSSITIGSSTQFVNLTNGSGYSYSNTTGLITIDPSFFTSAIPGLNNVLNTNNNYPATPNQYIFLPDGNQFNITLNDFHFIGCATLELCSQPAFSLSSVSDPNFHITYNTMCQMADPINPVPLIADVNWGMENYFVSNPVAWSDHSPDVDGATNPIPIRFTLNDASAIPGSLPWVITNSSGGNPIDLCSNHTYEAVLHFPHYYSIDVTNPPTVSAPGTLTPAFPLAWNIISVSGALTTDVSLDWSTITDPTLASSPFVSINVNLLLDCSASTWGTDDISIEFRAVCSTCPSCYRTYGCTDWPLSNHCGGSCVSDISTGKTDFVFERTTYGWVDQWDYEHYSTSHRVRTDFPSPLSQDLENFYDCDILHITCKGELTDTRLNTLTQLNFNVEYVPLNGANFLAFQGDGSDFHKGSLEVTPVGPSIYASQVGTFQVPISASQTSVFPNAIHHFSTNGSTLEIQPDMNFQVLLYNGTYVSLSSILQYKCHLKFDGDFKVNDHGGSVISDGVHHFQALCDFSYYYNSTNNQYSCDQVTTNLTYYKVSTTLLLNALYGPGWADQSYGFPYAGNASELRYVLFTQAVGGSPNSDDFPIEYRPIAKWPSQLTFRVPNGEFFYDSGNLNNPLNPRASYANSDWSASGYFPGANSPSIANPPTNCSVTVTQGSPDNIITVQPDGSWPLTVDKAPLSGNIPRQGFVLYLTRSCPINDRINHYLDNDPNANISIDNTITPPDVNILTHAYTPDGACQSTLDLCNNASTTACLFHYNAHDNGEFHRLSFTFPTLPFIGTSNNLNIGALTFDHDGTGYEFANLWTYFTAASGSSITFNNLTPVNPTYSVVNQISTPPLYELNSMFFHSSNLTAIDLNHKPVICQLNLSNFTCSGGTGQTQYDLVHFNINYGNSCDGYHPLKTGTLNGNASDFANSYTPCLYQSTELTIQPEHSSLYVQNVHDHFPAPTGVACDISIDFDIVNLDLGEVTGATFNIIPPSGYAMVTTGSYSYIEVRNSLDFSLITTIPISTLTSHPYNDIDNVLLVANSNHLYHLATGTHGVYLHYNVVFHPACVTEGNYNYNFIIDNITGTTSCGTTFIPTTYSTTIIPYTVPSGCSPLAAVVTTFSNPTCLGGNDGSITVSTIGGATYSWSPIGGTSATAINLPAGTYTCTVTLGASCTWTLTQTLTDPSSPTANITASGATTFCQGGSVTLTSDPASSYLWSTGEITQSIIVTNSGSYFVIVNNAAGCSSAPSSAINVTVNPAPATPTITASGATTFCQDGSVTLTSSSATGYLWSNGATTQSINVTIAGNYSVTISDASGCEAISSAIYVTVNSNPSIPMITASGSTSICQGNSVTLTSSSAPDYLWSTGGIFQSITISSAGSYSVTVTDQSGCSATSASTTVTVNSNPATPTITAGSSTTFCLGGSVILTSSAAISYLWSTGEATQAITVSTAGNYSVTVTNASGCTATSAPTTVTVNSPAPATPTITASGTTTFCQGGSVTLTSSTETSYLWSTGATTQAITVTTVGSYSVTVTDASGCTATSAATTVIVNSNPSAPVIGTSGSTVICTGSSVTLTSSPAIYYLWSTSAISQSITVSSAGSYSVTIINADGCTATSAPTVITEIPSPPTPIITANPGTTICQGDNVVLISSTAYGYLWSNGSNAQSITVNSPGNYSVSIFGTNGCQSSYTTITITVNANPPTPVITVNGSTSICNGGSVELSSSSASSYLWSNGAMTQTIYVTNPGNYSVTIFNANGCKSTSHSPTTVAINTSCCFRSNSTVNILTPTGYNSGGWSNDVVELNADITISSGTFSIIQSDVEIAHNVSIVVQNGATLFVDNSSYLHACTQMWNGIQLDAGATLIIQGNSTIQDALTAVYNDGGATIEIRNSTLTQNQVGIDLRNFNSSNLFDMYGSTIHGGDLLLPPNAGTHAVTGLRLTHTSDIPVGNPGYGLNTFDDLYYGVFGEIDGNLTVKNCHFANIYNQCDPPVPNIPGATECDHEAYAIYAVGSPMNPCSLTVGGGLVTERCDFLNCTNGIYTSGIVATAVDHNNFKIDPATFLGTTWNTMAILNEHHTGVDQSATWNSFDNYSEGIIDRDISDAHVTISHNTFNDLSHHLNVVNSDAIQVRNTTANLSTDLLIDQNYIFKYKRGIIATSIDVSTVISTNTIRLDLAVPGGNLANYGIRTQGIVTKLIVKGNSVERTLTGDPGTTSRLHVFGISVESSGDAVISNNSTTKMGRGMHFFNNAIAQAVLCNHLIHCISGIDIQLGNNLGSQGSSVESSDNEWISLDNSSDRWSNIENNTTGAPPIWHVRMNDPVYDPDPTNGTGGTNYIMPFWTSIIRTSGSNPNQSCDKPCDPYCTEINIYNIANELNPYNNLVEDAKYALKTYAFKLLANNNELMNLGTSYDESLQVFYDSMQTTNPGILETIADLMAQDDTVSAKIINSFITADNLGEDNAKKVNEVYLDTWSREVYDFKKFSQEQKDLLLNIAYQNPSSGGNAVYAARVMLGIDMDDFSSETERMAALHPSVKGSENRRQGTIIPNPNNGTMQFVFSLNEDEKGILQIYDSKGNMQKFYTLQPGTSIHDIDMSGADCGMYFCRLSINNEIIMSSKIVIER
ncbi:MAG: T9SS type A sorting domain-containing protein [Bacteroidetes bacterium]|nr:T9SS type A sorting domain-containing protein [Bacteroidota bacterium]